jgi:hypothetical protein
MSIFISYSHKDSDFVDKLGTALVLNQIRVYIDRWEMNVGDSITERVANAITEASFLIVALSKHSVESPWCKREINTGLMLELEKRRVVVLPILLEDCSIPLFLQDKLYADFRSDFDTGLKQVISSIGGLPTEEMGRIEDSETAFSDFSYSWGLRGNQFELQIDYVEYSIIPDKPNTILIKMIFVGNDLATARYKIHKANGLETAMKSIILLTCAEDKGISGMAAHIVDDQPFETLIHTVDPKTGIGFTGHITVKRLGLTDKKDKVYFFGGLFKKLLQDLHPKFAAGL